MIIPVCWVPQDSPAKEGHLPNLAEVDTNAQAEHVTYPGHEAKEKEARRLL